MKRRILLVNLVLLGVALWLGYTIRQNWLAAQARERQLLAMRPPAVNVPAPAPVPAPVIAPAAGYADLAMRTLFAKDRNPNVIVEPPPAPPPPPPVPPFPYSYGVLDLGDGPQIAMAPRGGRQKFYQKGAQVGEFKLAEIRPDSVVLEWQGKTFEKKLSDLADRTGGSDETARTPTPQSGQPPIYNAPPPPPVAAKSDPTPGGDIGGGIRGCNPGDTSPNGTVVGGMRKIITSSPFGSSCRWEPVR
ncbi:MAG: general secretion pathway protein GspB [Bryobacteraceae bacterium]|nr:general secretion pathway protein GspB [Bryobacteraceae bacterium]